MISDIVNISATNMVRISKVHRGSSQKTQRLSLSHISGDRISWGIGIEQEVALLYDVPYMLQVSKQNPRPYPVREAVSIAGSLKARFRSLMLSRRYPMEVTEDLAADGRHFIEFVTRDFANRQLYEYVADLKGTSDVFLADVNFMVLPFDQGKKAVWPLTGADYVLYHRDKRIVDIPRYLGSYHINLTLPHKADIDKNDFKNMHVVAAMALQWLEPLLLSALGCPSPASVLDGHQVTEMSLRHADEALAMALARDLAHGIPSYRRYNEWKDPITKIRKHASKNPHAAERDISLKLPGQFQFNAADSKSRARALAKIAQNMKATADEFPMWLKTIFRNSLTSPMALKHFVRHRFGTLENDHDLIQMPIIGTDFRRDTYKGERFGFEFRLLDYFPADDLLNVLRLMFYAMDASASWSKIVNDPYECAAVHNQYVAIILEGWDTKFDDDYKKRLEDNFGLKGRIKGDTCYDALNSISKTLFEKFGNGKGLYSRHVDCDANGVYHSKAPIITNVNRSSWESFFEKSFPDIAAYVRHSSVPMTVKTLTKLLKGQASQFGVQEDLFEILAYQHKYSST